MYSPKQVPIVSDGEINDVDGAEVVVYQAVGPQGQPDEGDEERCAVPARDAVDEHPAVSLLDVVQHQLHVVLGEDHQVPALKHNSGDLVRL